MLMIILIEICLKQQEPFSNAQHFTSQLCWNFLRWHSRYGLAAAFLNQTQSHRSPCWSFDWGQVRLKCTVGVQSTKNLERGPAKSLLVSKNSSLRNTINFHISTYMNVNYLFMRFSFYQRGMQGNCRGFFLRSALALDNTVRFSTVIPIKSSKSTS